MATKEKTVQETIDELIAELEKENKAGNKKEAKKIRRILRGMKFYRSKGKVLTEEELKARKAKEEPKVEEPKKKKAKKEAPKEEPSKDPEGDRILKATSAKEVFGPDSSKWKSEFRRLSKKYHPDTENGNAEVMKKINHFWDLVKKNVK